MFVLLSRLSNLPKVCLEPHLCSTIHYDNDVHNFSTQAPWNAFLLCILIVLIDYSALHPHWALPFRVLWSVWFKRLVSPTAFCCLVYTLSNFVSTWSYRSITSFIFDGPITCYCRDFVYIRVTGAQLKPTLLRINWDRTVLTTLPFQSSWKPTWRLLYWLNLQLYVLWFN